MDVGRVLGDFDGDILIGGSCFAAGVAFIGKLAFLMVNDLIDIGFTEDALHITTYLDDAGLYIL